MATATKVRKASTSHDGQLERSDSPQCLAGDLSWLLSQAHFALASEINSSFGPLGISGRAFHVLATARTGEHTQTELAEAIGLDKTTMVVTLDELEEAGLAERRQSKTDRRARVVKVTRAGERKVAQGQRLIEEIQEDVLGELAPRERELFLDALGKLVRERFSDELHCTPLRRREPKP